MSSSSVSFLVDRQVLGLPGVSSSSASFLVDRQVLGLAGAGFQGPEPLPYGWLLCFERFLGAAVEW
jgi:hypothetical protein